MGDGQGRLRMAVADIAKVGPSAAQLASERAREKGDAGAGGGAGAGPGSAYRKRNTPAGAGKGSSDGPKLSEEELLAQLPTAFGGGVATKQQRGVKRSAEEMHDAFKRVASGKKFVVKKAVRTVCKNMCSRLSRSSVGSRDAVAACVCMRSVRAMAMMYVAC